MFKSLKNALSFHWSDVVGLCIGMALVVSCTDSELFELVISAPLYVFVFLGIFLLNSWMWLLGYHGETAYLKSASFGIIKNYVRIILATLSMIGFYFFFRSFF